MLYHIGCTHDYGPSGIKIFILTHYSTRPIIHREQKFKIRFRMHRCRPNTWNRLMEIKNYKLPVA